MESHNQWFHGVYQNHWQEYQASHWLAQRRNAPMLTCQWKSQKKRRMNAPKLNLKERRGYPHIGTIMRLLSTLTEPGAFIQGGDVPWRKVHCTLSERDKKFWTTHRAISLSGLLDWCTLTKIEKRPAAALDQKQIVSRVTNVQDYIAWVSFLIDRVAVPHLCTGS